MRKDRLLEWFSDDDYSKLNQTDRISLLEFRKLFTKMIKREKKIKRSLQRIKRDKEELKMWSDVLTTLNGKVDHLRSNYVFSLTVIKNRKKNNIYYNFTLKRKGKSTKSIYLGTEKNIRNHMEKYYGDSKYQNPKTDWINYLNWSGYSDDGEIRLRILNMILDDPIGFDKRKVTLSDILPYSDFDKLKNGSSENPLERGGLNVR